MKRTLVAAMLVAFTVAIPSAQPTSESPAVAEFKVATRNYVAMHRRLERIAGPITLNSSVESIDRSMQALATAIRAERTTAKQGDLFTAALAPELRARVNNALLEHGFTPADIYRSAEADGIFPSSTGLRINGTFPWLLATAMFPCVIAALPPLPSELQYRIVGNDLLLIDVHASLIVDILPELLPGTTFWDDGPKGAQR